MAYHYTSITNEKGIAILVINNPPANTLSSKCIAELRLRIKMLSEDTETKAIIITGAGRFFVAGADIKEFVSAFGDKEKGLAMAEAGQALCNEIELLNKPVIAAINGPALGGGLELAMGCHYRIAADTAVVGLPELKLGLIPTFGGTQRLRNLTSIPVALELILTGKQLSAAEAVENDIVQLTVPYEELLQTAKTLANSLIAGKSMTSITRVIECIINGSNETLHDSLMRERKKFAELFLTSDAKEGVQAFIEKRLPQFKHE